MSSSSIQSAAQSLGKLVLQEVQYLAAVSDKVGELQSELEWMQCFLLDADKQQTKNTLIHKWVSGISDLALEAEDITEMYILEVSTKKEAGILNCVHWLACFWMDAITLHQLGSQIDCITSKISKLSSRLQTYGVRSSYDVHFSQTTTSKKLLAEQRRTYSHAQPDSIVGIEQEVAEITKLLQEGSQKVVVAHGMGGIGKTALARQVFHNCLSQGHFLHCAWAYVSQQCNLGAVCKELLDGLIPTDDAERSVIDGLEVSKLVEKLSEVLKRNNYLVVLDDVWTVRDWTCLEPAFPIHDSSCGSRILVTTRNPQIFSKLGNHLVETRKAETLKSDSCWELLEKRGHFTKNTLDPSMKEVAQKMLDHCNGHPLAIVVLGGVLATKKSFEEWESVCENLQTYLQGDDESYSGVYEVLAMSYCDLDYHLKSCFLHMGHFPEDSRINVQKLYHLWIADGLLSPAQDRIGKNRSLEEIADSYLNQLVQKGMIQVDETDSDGRIQTCRLHDLMRDKCLEMTREENFLHIVNIDEQQKASTDGGTDKSRRVSMYVGKEDSKSVLKSLLGKHTSLRSLMFFSTSTGTEDNCEWVQTICETFKLIRVLDFDGVVLQGPLPKQLGNLIYLRHLCLKWTQVTELPSSIRNLKLLLILDLRVMGAVITVPNVLSEMTSLCYLYFPWRQLSQEGYPTQGYKTNDGNQLILDNLSHLELIVNVDLDEVDVKGLLELTSLRKLSATCKRQKQSLLPFLKSRSIKHLNLSVDANILLGEPKILLSESFSLRVLHVDADKNSHTYLPIQVGMFPWNLVELGFWYCILNEDPMPILENLPKLRNLQLHICYRGNMISCSKNAFPELTYLMLDGLFFLRDWNVGEGGFPKLQKMEIYNCPLKKIPVVLPPKIIIGCTDNLQPVVDEFRKHGNSNDP